MTTSLLPPVPQDKIGETHNWRDWFFTLGRYISSLQATGSSLLWSAINYNGSVTNISTNSTLSDSYDTAIIITSGLTIALPPANSFRIGYSWTIIFAAVGWVDITVTGGDSINLPTSDNKIRLTNKGASITLKCLSANSWGIV